MLLLEQRFRHSSREPRTIKKGHREMALDTDITAPRHQVLMILRPAGRFLTIPFPPGPFAARFFAAVILPPLLFFAMVNPFCSCVVDVSIQTTHYLRERFFL